MKKASDLFGAIAGLAIVTILVLLCCLPWVDDVFFHLRVIYSLIGVVILFGLMSEVLDRVIEKQKGERKKLSMKSFKEKLEELHKDNQ